jgi:hypothetical protein
LVVTEHQHYVADVRKLENKFTRLEIHHVIRDNNIGEDILSKLGSTRAQVPFGVFVQELHHPSIKKTETIDQVPKDQGLEVMMIDEAWRTKIIDFITDEKLSTEKTKAITNRQKKQRLCST